MELQGKNPHANEIWNLPETTLNWDTRLPASVVHAKLKRPGLEVKLHLKEIFVTFRV